MGSVIDGLISGLSTTALIAQLMQVEAAPQTALKAKVSSTGSFVTALQALNTKVASLGDSAKTAALPGSWTAVTPTSTATSVTATALAGSQPGSLTFSTTSIAKGQTSVGILSTDLASFFPPSGVIPSSLTLATGTTAAPTVTAIDLTGVTDLAGLAGKINDAKGGVTATIVRVSSTQSRLQLTGTTTGTASGFDLYSGTVSAADVTAGTVNSAGALMGRDPSTLVTGATDASITLWQGTGAQQIITSASNTFTGLLTGVNLTISAVEANPVTVTVARNDAALQKLASGLVDNLSLVLSEIASQTKSTSTTDSTGRTLLKGGVLSGDSAVRDLQQSVTTAATDPVNGVSPSSMGMVLGKDGAITFDATIFAAALAADPAKVQAVISGLATRVQTLSTNLSAPTTGALSLKIQGQQTYVKDLNDQVSNWDVRLALKQTALNKTYASLEVALGKLKDQSDWLAGQLATSSTTG